MAAMVEIQDLSKRFGSHVAVSKLSLTMEEGDVLGFIGPNGAGKSTTLKMLATIMRPTSGRAKVGGRDVVSDAQSVRRIIGYMPDVCGLYDDMLVHEYLSFFAAIYGVVGERRNKALDDVLGLTGLEEKRNSLCRALSRGMSQRLHLARVLLHDPKLLLLDEPASGLDPRARIEFRDLVLALRKLGKTLIISSHILSELGEMCNTMAIIEQSKLVYCGSVQGASQQVSELGRVYEVAIVENLESGSTLPNLLELARGLPYVDAVREAETPGMVLVRLKQEFAEPHLLNAELIRRGFWVRSFAEQKVRLEDTFLHLTKGVVQ